MNCAAAISRREGVLVSGLVVIFFFFAGALNAAHALFLRIRYKMNLREVSLRLFIPELLCLLTILFLGGFWELSVGGGNFTKGEINILASLMGAAMGFQAVAIKEAVANSPPTGVVTSTLINVGTFLSHTISYGVVIRFLRLTQRMTKKAGFESVKNAEANSTKELDPSGEAADIISIDQHVDMYQKKFDEAFTKFLNIFLPLTVFIVGAIIGGVMIENLGFFAMAVPAGIVIAIVVDIYTATGGSAAPISNKEGGGEAPPQRNEEPKPLNVEKKQSDEAEAAPVLELIELGEEGRATSNQRSV